MTEPSNCLCSLISTALDVSHINLPNNTGNDHVCVTAMDIPDDWNFSDDWESDEPHTGSNFWSDERFDSTNMNNNVTQLAIQPDPPGQFQPQQSFHFQSLQSRDELTPKPAPLSSWTGAYFNKSTNFYNNSVSNLMPEKEMEQTRLFELYRLHMVSFELNQGDTLVFIDYPVHHKGVLNHTDCNGIVYKSQQFRIHSSKLLETGSSKFAELLGPTYQFKIQRHRKMVNKLPEGIKYLIDLTPPSEGDELVFQMTELSLPPGIIQWWRSYTLNGTDPFLVCGHDDVCMCCRQPKKPDTEGNEDSKPSGGATGFKLKEFNLLPERALQMKAANDDEVLETPPYRHIPDYCPIRHRNGIVRLLMLIEGKGAILDSAARLWTLVKLSNIFDCSNIIRDRVTQWIMHGQNTTFIEVLPEEALQMGFLLQIPQVVDCSFRILVNELALKLAADKKQHLEPSQTTIFGRRKGHLPDELSNTVQHAAQALVDRVSETDAQMMNQADLWNGSDEWQKLLVTEQLLQQEDAALSGHALDKLRTLMRALTREVEQVWEDVMNSTPPHGHETYISIDQDRLTYVKPTDFEKATVIMQGFNRVQMLLCAAPYNDAGVKLDDRRWNNSRCTLDGYKNRSYPSLVEETTRALDNFLACSPQLANHLLWRRICALDDRSFPLMGLYAEYKPIISLYALECDVKNRIRPITLSWRRKNIELPLNRTRHLLLTLTENELKYLPLWCGGNDDGSGGVFEDRIPPADLLLAPNGPGPGYHTGMTTIPSTPSSVTGSMIEDMDALRVWGTTTGASINVHDSISTVYRPDQVIAEDKSIASESFTIGGSGSEYENARYAVPAEHQAMGEAVNMAVETTDSETTEAWNSNNEDDLYMWNDEGDSDESTDTIS
ncbi:hypothetical protein F53441_985 [Fusarium austroafricanum]|uniref:Uncharacterized protein n=1 Tax=Fusarium austroafricanum TaxID=2364996 RepID=A0A8H4KT48_9HYPO|nr:hypothetical protein F53441_985 [Fusarium austroafricanum]